MSDLIIKPLNEEIDSQLATALHHFASMPKPSKSTCANEEHKESHLRSEVLNIRKVLESVRPKTL